MYKSELHSILLRSLVKASWTRSTKDEDNFRQVICSHLYEHLSPNNTEIPSTRSGSGDIRIFGRKIELKYSNYDKRDKLEWLLDDIDLLVAGRVDFCVFSFRFEREHNDLHVSRALELPLLKGSGASAPIAKRSAPTDYYGPGILLPVCYPEAISRISVTTAGISKKTNSYLRFNLASNIDRSIFVCIGNSVMHVDVIGSCEDGLLTLLYKIADGVRFSVNASHDVVVPYLPAPIKVATHDVADVFTSPGMIGKSVELLQKNASVFRLDA